MRRNKVPQEIFVEIKDLLQNYSERFHLCETGIFPILEFGDISIARGDEPDSSDAYLKYEQICFDFTIEQFSEIKQRYDEIVTIRRQDAVQKEIQRLQKRIAFLKESVKVILNKKV
jgi:hypothetical protein